MTALNSYYGDSHILFDVALRVERNEVDGKQVADRMRALKKLGDPYTDAEIGQAAQDVTGKTELDAVVAYLQALGKHAPRGG